MTPQRLQRFDEPRNVEIEPIAIPQGSKRLVEPQSTNIEPKSEASAAMGCVTWHWSKVSSVGGGEGILGHLGGVVSEGRAARCTVNGVWPYDDGEDTVTGSP